MRKLLAKGFTVDLVFASITLIAALVVFFLFVGIFLTLISESSLAIHEFGFWHFITSSDWNPVKNSFGALTTVYGTVLTTLLSLFIAVPTAIGIGIFVTEIAPFGIRNAIGSAIELLAAIPSIIYGMWGLFTLSPLMRDYVEPFLQTTTSYIPLIHYLFEGTPRGIDVLTASIILSIMIIPFIASISRDAFNLTPQIVKESAYAVGCTKWEVIKDVVMPYSKYGVFGGILLALGRALGETMAVAFVLGNNHRITTSLLDAGTTITVTLANEFAEADQDLYLSSLFYLALILFGMSFVTLALAKLLFMREGETKRGE